MVEPPETPLPGTRSALEPDRAIKPGRHGLAPEAVAAIQRDRLIDAFVQVVAERGYAGATIGRITEAAGVTKKAFYTHFTELDDCFLAAYERGTAIVLTAMSGAFGAEPTWPDGIRAALRTVLSMLAAAPAFARMSMVEVNAAGPRVRRARTECMERFRAFFAGPGPGPGESPVPTVVADAVVGGVYSTIYTHIEKGDTARLPELLPQLTYFALMPLVGRREAARYMDTSTSSPDAAGPARPESVAK
ncbi:TetR/AcrR family transcriptional regulator [Actinomadura rupiterrae]|uniref:TetR/AcrR family transcriptional regulator n=1 Tax=Actinomadura rupiterrae TaxID=559627 RepID=UPI0020A48228|nr:TetR/AcrR family transcriptional regulator [Actinomadura rupiterrae]MCP2340298.1 AcrR family transcriptional regulator [Actinomadura rupiterrae]